MLLILKFNKLAPEKQLQAVGYTKRRWKDWIKVETDGRWHLHKLEYGVYSIHFDLNVGDTHYAPHMPLKVKAEIRRINKKFYHIQEKVGESKMKEIFDKYRFN